MILASHQPDFMPWMGYFYKIFQCDTFVFSDNVLFSKSARHNYNDILTGNGVQRLTLPIHYEMANVGDMQIAATEKDINRMLKTIQQSYGKAAHFKEVYPDLEKLMKVAPGQKLGMFNWMCIVYFCSRFGLMSNRRFFMSSDLPLKEKRDARIIEMCKLFHADTYISGSGAKDYHVEEDYRKNGIKLVYSDYQPLRYPQVKGREAINLSVIDYVMNMGFKLPEEWRRYE